MADTTTLSLIGKALSHPLRERMLRMLADGERCGCEFAPALGVDASMVSRYLGILERAGLVTSRREGVRVLWRVRDLRILALLKEIEGVVQEGVMA